MHARSETPPLGSHHRLIFSLQLALSFAGIVACVVAVAAAAHSVHHDAARAHAVSVLGTGLTYPTLNVAAALLLVLAGIGLGVFIAGVLSAMRLRHGYRQFVEQLPLLDTLPGRPDVTVFAGDVPQAFCAGYLRPRIYVSAGAVELLTPDELEAVLRHERQHLEARDPLRLACARVLGRALFFLPALAPLADRYVELAELRADDAAVRAAGGDRRALAAALLAFESGSPPGSGGLAAERVDALLGEPPVRRLPSPLIAISLIVLTALIVLVWRASSVAAAHASFDLPLVSAQPCMLVLALVPVVAFLALAATRRTLSLRR